MELEDIKTYLKKTRDSRTRRSYLVNWLRNKTYQKALQVIAADPGISAVENIRLTPLNEQVRQAWVRQWEPLLATDPFQTTRYLNCENLTDDPRDPLRFQVAIWHGETLCGVSTGGQRRDYEKGYISVFGTEGHPDPCHPLKGLVKPIVHYVVSAYGRELGASTIAYMGPFSDGALKQAERMGFSFGAGSLGEQLGTNNAICVPIVAEAGAIRPSREALRRHDEISRAIFSKPAPAPI